MFFGLKGHSNSAQGKVLGIENTHKTVRVKMILKAKKTPFGRN